MCEYAEKTFDSVITNKSHVEEVFDSSPTVCEKVRIRLFLLPSGLSFCSSLYLRHGMLLKLFGVWVTSHNGAFVSQNPTKQQETFDTLKAETRSLILF